MAAGNTVQPSFDAAGQREVGRVDRQHQRTVEDAAIEPLRQHKLHAMAMPARIDQLLPFVDPGELHSSPIHAVTDRGQDHSGLEPLQRPLQPDVLTLSRSAADRDQELIGREAEEAGSPEAVIGGLDDLAGSPDQHIGVPDGCYAVLGKTVHLDPDSTSLVEDWGSAPALGETEEGLAHQVALVAQADAVVGESDERIEARALGTGEAVAHQPGARV